MTSHSALPCLLFLKQQNPHVVTVKPGHSLLVSVILSQWWQIEIFHPPLSQSPICLALSSKFSRSRQTSNIRLVEILTIIFIFIWYADCWQINIYIVAPTPPVNTQHLWRIMLCSGCIYWKTVCQLKIKTKPVMFYDRNMLVYGDPYFVGEPRLHT